jgi:hypothetical protein
MGGQCAAVDSPFPRCVEEAGEGDPTAEDVIYGFGEVVARREAVALLAHPDFKIVDERL